MKNSKFSEVQIIKILSEQNQGKTVNEICLEHGISQPSFYKWKSKFGGLDVEQLTRMKEMEKELSQYKKNRGRTYPGKRGNERCDRKKALTPSEKRKLVVYSVLQHGVSTRNACRLFYHKQFGILLQKQETMKMTRSGKSWFCLQNSIRPGDSGRCTPV